MGLLRGWRQPRRRAAAHDPDPAGMAARRLGTDLRPVGIGGPRRAAGAARDAAADQGVAADARPERPRRRGGTSETAPISGSTAAVASAARGLAHRRRACWRAAPAPSCCGRPRHDRTPHPCPALDRDMTQASDEQLLRVVGLIDTLDRRGHDGPPAGAGARPAGAAAATPAADARAGADPAVRGSAGRRRARPGRAGAACRAPISAAWSSRSRPACRADRGSALASAPTATA